MKKLFICLCVSLSMACNCLSVYAQESTDTTTITDVEESSTENQTETEEQDTSDQQEEQEPAQQEEQPSEQQEETEEDVEEETSEDIEEEIEESEEKTTKSDKKNSAEGDDEDDDDDEDDEEKTASVTYKARVETYGWQSWRTDGVVAGTTGKSKRLEAIQIKLKDCDYEGGIEYSSYVQKSGWQDWVGNGDISGTVNQNKRIEMIQIQLTGEVAEYYDLYYCVQVQDLGWLDWAVNGGIAGTKGMNYRIEAIKIQLVEKGEKAPGSTSKAYVTKEGKSNVNYISYKTRMQTYGWQSKKYDGVVAGSAGKSKRLENLIIYKEGALSEIDGDIRYKSYVQNVGWQDGVSSGETSGVKGLRTEAIRINLTGDLKSKYDIYYRTYVQNYGWLGWAKNGATAGTSDLSCRMEAIQIQLVKKGGKAPGSTSVPYKNPKILLQEKINAQLKRYDAVSDTIIAQSGGSLQSCYLWIVNNMSRFLYFPGTGSLTISPYQYLNQEQTFAVYGIENRQGNCYVYASMFAACARKLGYNCTFIMGCVRLANGSYNSGHGWTEINVDGVTYVCDPEGQQETGKNLYFTTYATAPIGYVKY